MIKLQYNIIRSFQLLSLEMFQFSSKINHVTFEFKLVLTQQVSYGYNHEMEQNKTNKT